MTVAAAGSDLSGWAAAADAGISRRAAIAGAAVLLLAAGNAMAEDRSITAADGRPVPLRLWRARGKARGLLAFSHGANAAPAKYDRLGAALAAGGYDVAAPLHMDSPDHPGGGKVDRALANGLRLADMRAIFANRAMLGMTGGPAVAAGHSFGAMIAQMLGGAAIGGPAVVEPGIAAVVAWSPPGPFPPMLNPGAWASIARPMLVQTGTADTLPMMAPTWQVHRASFDEAPGPAALFVGTGVDHYFGNIICRPERTEPPQEAQFADAVAVTLQFLALALAGKPLTPLARAPVAGASWVEVK